MIAFVQGDPKHAFLVQSFFVFLALRLIGIRLNPTATAVIALGLNGGVYAIEIIRGGVEGIPRGQTDAGLALDLQTRSRVPPHRPATGAARVFPSMASQFILLTLTTSVHTSIAAHERAVAARRIDGDAFQSFEVCFMITLIFLLLSWAAMFALSGVARLAFNHPRL